MTDMRALAAHVGLTTLPTAPVERDILIPTWALAIAALALVLFGVAIGYVAFGAPVVHAPVGHTVSCQVAGGPACTRNTVLDPEGTN